jgi:hypothetical protein
MRESEKWRLVAQRVAEGNEGAGYESVAVGVTDLEWERWVEEPQSSLESMDRDSQVIYALLLAEEAEDEENATVLITYCAEDPPMPVVFVGPEPEQDEPEVALGNYPVDRRKSWNEKLADGLRKWADTVEGW